LFWFDGVILGQMFTFASAVFTHDYDTDIGLHELGYMSETEGDLNL
jgi:hypothetical protein